MRLKFEQWALRNGYRIRRREDQPDRYLLVETERLWQIWVVALQHGQRRRPSLTPAAALRDKVLDDVLAVCQRMGPDGDIDTIKACIAALRRPAPWSSDGDAS